ncbi:MAG TPA: hypothetical protein VHX62_02080 [Solirubrobacteraceae bacterium]|nr:hypothetical protein [Solirubrobacteraceae bacterium]
MSTVEHPATRAGSRWTTRRVVTDVLLTLITLLTVVGIVAIWANRQLLNADNWASTSTSLLQNPTIRTATANYLVDQLYANVDVSGEVQSALPQRLKPLADPIAGALRSAAVSGTELALSRPVVQNAWRVVNRAADAQLIQIINGGGRAVSVNGGAVTLNLRNVLNDVAGRLGISADLGAKLPPAAANLVVLRSDQLSLVQDIGQGLSGLAVALYIIVPLLCIATMIIAIGRRRRTLLSIGVAGIVAGLIVILFRSLIVTNVANALVKDASLRPAANAVVSIATTLLTQVAGAVILIGVVVAVCAWFAGPSRFTVPARRWLAPHVRAHPVGMYLVVAMIVLLIFIWQPIPSTGQPIGMIVYVILAALGTETLRRQMDREFPESGLPAPSSDGVEPGAPLQPTAP